MCGKPNKKSSLEAAENHLIFIKTFALKSELILQKPKIKLWTFQTWTFITTTNALNETLPSAEKEIVKTKATQKLLADPDKSQ